MLQEILTQIKKLALFFLLLYILPLLFLIAMGLTSVQMDIPLALFTRDPAAVADIHPFTGIASNLGVLLWASTAAICLFSWVSLRRNSVDKNSATFLFYAGLMTIILTFDDLFLLHENIFPDYLGISQKIVLIIYLGLLLVGLVKFRKDIMKTEYLILLIALAFFGLSIFTDVFDHQIKALIGDWHYLFEDGFKLLGIVGWFGYFLRICLIFVSGNQEKIPGMNKARD